MSEKPSPSIYRPGVHKEEKEPSLPKLSLGGIRLYHQDKSADLIEKLQQKFRTSRQSLELHDSKIILDGILLRCENLTQVEATIRQEVPKFPAVNFGKRGSVFQEDEKILEFINDIEDLVQSTDVSKIQYLQFIDVFKLLSKKLNAIELSVLRIILCLDQCDLDSKLKTMVRSNHSVLKISALFNDFVEVFQRLVENYNKNDSNSLDEYSRILQKEVIKLIVENFSTYDGELKPISLVKFRNTLEGEAVYTYALGQLQEVATKKKEEMLTTLRNATIENLKKTGVEFVEAGESSSVPEKKKHHEEQAKRFSKHRQLKDKIASKKIWYPELVRLISSSPSLPDFNAILDLINKYYRSIDNFEDCTKEVKNRLLGERRKKKYSFFEQLWRERNKIFLQKIGLDIYVGANGTEVRKSEYFLQRLQETTGGS